MKNRILTPLALAFALLFCGIACFAGPTFARTVNTDAWTGRIDPPPANDASNVSCGLLQPDGQMRILLPDEDAQQIPIELKSENGRIRGTLLASGDWVDVSPASTALDYNETGSATVTLQTMIIAEREIEGVLQNTPSVVTFDVTWTGEDLNGDAETISATFVINRTEEDDSERTGAIVNPPQWYSPKSDIVVYLNGSATIKLNDGKFPAMTKYEIDGVTTVLYSENYISVENAGTVFIDLSDTNVSGQIELSTVTSDCILTEVGNISPGIGGRPLVVGDRGASLLMPYRWAGITPEFTAWRMVRDGNGVTSWNATNLVNCTEDDGGSASITAPDAPAGTYKLLLEWNYNGHTLYSCEICFFVRHDNCGHGGISR